MDIDRTLIRAVFSVNEMFSFLLLLISNVIFVLYRPFLSEAFACFQPSNIDLVCLKLRAVCLYYQKCHYINESSSRDLPLKHNTPIVFIPALYVDQCNVFVYYFFVM